MGYKAYMMNACAQSSISDEFLEGEYGKVRSGTIPAQLESLRGVMNQEKEHLSRKPWFLLAEERGRELAKLRAKLDTLSADDVDGLLARILQVTEPALLSPYACFLNVSSLIL